MVVAARGLVEVVEVAAVEAVEEEEAMTEAVADKVRAQKRWLNISESGASCCTRNSVLSTNPQAIEPRS